MFLIAGSPKKTDFENKIKTGIKLHTIRLDEHRRWRAGMKIHFATGVRTSNYNNFMMGECKSVQDCEVLPLRKEVYVECRELTTDEIEELAINDGFDSVADFWDYFSSYGDFEGRIIHWTDLKY